MIRLLRLALLVLALPSSVLAQPAPDQAASPAPAACDPATSACYAVEGWLLTARTWTPGGAEPRDLVGGRLQAEVRWHRWRWAARGDATGIPGEYQQGKWETVRSVEAHVASAYDALRLPGGVSLGPAVAVGAAVGIEEDDEGRRAQMPKRLTAGLGARASGPGWWAYAVVGQYQALHGFAAVVTWQVAVSGRVANIGTAAVGSRTWTATTGVAVRWR